MPPRVTAVLGPTNTGKTYLAVERMLGHASGMIGFPLRLLARENYDRIARIKGKGAVALVTGEEKIVPPNARYWICTVESMPLDRTVAFLAIDEIQLCADAERGHVFTDRLLHARGREETMFLGAETIAPLLRKLVPGIEFITRPRFSNLSYAGEKKLTRLPPRSAVVAFSANDVYALAETMRRQRGGTAVVLGALSPRTRNAQVEMYQAGEVDYLVATDAIGMGLNMDVDHVAFARLSKFDGHQPRRLRAPEVAQIAGRAGRHMSDGTFGTTDGIGPLDEAMVDAVENHRFEALRTLMWRNTDLNFRSPQLLLKSLDAHAPHEALRRVREADDHLALQALVRDEEILRLATNPGAVRLLWDICQIPDFRKVLTDAHTRLLGQLYRFLMTPEGRLPQDWVARQVSRLDNVEGDIDALVQRIAHVRTWTYVSHRPNWLDDPAHWQERSRAIEDRLSDALHERLTQRFVDRRSAALVRGLKGKGELLGHVDPAKEEVFVEGEFVGRLEGFRFHADTGRFGEDARALTTAARRVLRDEIAARVRRLEQAEDTTITLEPDLRLRWNGAPVARLAAGPDWLAPSILPDGVDDLLEPAQRERVRARIDAWLRAETAATLGALLALRDAPLAGAARGLAFQLVEGYGTLPRPAVEPAVRTLTRADRKALAALGVTLGPAHLFLPALLKPRAARLRGLLWTAATGASPVADALRGTRKPVRASAGPGLDAAQAYVTLGDRAVRVDLYNRLALAALKAAKDGVLAATPELARLLGGDTTLLEVVLAALGYRRKPAEGDAAEGTAPAYGARRPRPRRKPARHDPDSPFAVLRHFATAPGGK